LSVSPGLMNQNAKEVAGNQTGTSMTNLSLVIIPDLKIWKFLMILRIYH